MEFMADTNINFFDTNKLYIKSLVDYKTKQGKKQKDTSPSEQSGILPSINKKAVTRKNSSV